MLIPAPDPGERKELERWIAEGNAREQLRARIILCRAKGISQEETARTLNCSSRCVWKWTLRFRQSGIKGLRDAPRRRCVKERSNELGRTRPLARKNQVPPSTQAPPNQTTRHQKPEEQTKGKRERPSYRSIANTAGVSPMTVSRVLSNHPGVSAHLRDLVLNTARDMGYQPDPALRKLMLHLRQRKVTRLQGSICSLESTAWRSNFDRYFRGVVGSAKARAESLGFAWEVFPLEEFLARPKHTTRILYHRGVEGILLQPSPAFFANRVLPSDAMWNLFSVVAASRAITSPSFRRVVPDHVKNLILACRSLTERGASRIGLVLAHELERLVNYHFTAGYTSFHFSTGREMHPPFLYHNRNDHHQLREWYNRTKPDALIVSSGRAAGPIAEALGLSIPGPVMFAAVGYLEDKIAGIDELPEQVGAIAVDILSGMIMHHEKGIPGHPTTTTVEGVWREIDSSR